MADRTALCPSWNSDMIVAVGIQYFTVGWSGLMRNSDLTRIDFYATDSAGNSECSRRPESPRPSTSTLVVLQNLLQNRICHHTHPYSVLYILSYRIDHPLYLYFIQTTLWRDPHVSLTPPPTPSPHVAPSASPLVLPPRCSSLSPLCRGARRFSLSLSPIFGRRSSRGGAGAGAWGSTAAAAAMGIRIPVSSSSLRIGRCCAGEDGGEGLTQGS
jgi:hypothetical protein